MRPHYDYDYFSGHKKSGYWSAVLCTVFSLAYVLAQFAEWFGWLGSQGGSESSALGIALLLTPSLLFGSAFLARMVSIYQITLYEREQ